MPICLGAHFSWCPLFPSTHLHPMPNCPNAHQSQSAHLPQNAHLSQSPPAHLSQIPICSKCSLPQWPKAHFLWCPIPPMPTCPNVHWSQSAHLLHSAHLPQSLIFPGAHLSWCSFTPSAHFFPMPTCPNAHQSQSAYLP